MDILEKLNWRYATKAFDPSKKLNNEQLSRLLEATNLAPTSFGLQPFKILLIETSDIRVKLQKAAWNQPQTTEASHLLIFAANLELNDDDIDNFLSRTSEIRNIPLSSLAEYETMMKGFVAQMTSNDLAIWSAKQAYIALGQLMVAASVEGIDTCPMEGFDKGAVDKILDLPNQKLGSVVMAAVGFRSKDDKYQHLPKVRKPLDEIIIKL
ncbi:NAD(P)H-dependent oxidoreductase [Carboxylicivirga sp. M1479]|uniref:NAD(P)H-dependent oxidoreductase n=1 Tax=Carboxylicivirga sp. M1479 TaxID=2594476 RepID=UPI0011787A71|nr:NAD(P)H-dependent oxidoreductase [Carboxylicivirga sp. M1479]TRX71969.1 NAD(P)H-dependent oxidoreductase [Carboxylicivirga sp. M1479]